MTQIPPTNIFLVEQILEKSEWKVGSDRSLALLQNPNNKSLWYIEISWQNFGFYWESEHNFWAKINRTTLFWFKNWFLVKSDSSDELFRRNIRKKPISVIWFTKKKPDKVIYAGGCGQFSRSNSHETRLNGP